MIVYNGALFFILEEEDLKTGDVFNVLYKSCNFEVTQQYKSLKTKTDTCTNNNNIYYEKNINIVNKSLETDKFYSYKKNKKRYICVESLVLSKCTLFNLTTHGVSRKPEI